MRVVNVVETNAVECTVQYVKGLAREACSTTASYTSADDENRIQYSTVQYSIADGGAVHELLYSKRR